MNIHGVLIGVKKSALPDQAFVRVAKVNEVGEFLAKFIGRFTFPMNAAASLYRLSLVPEFT